MTKNTTTDSIKNAAASKAVAEDVDDAEDAKDGGADETSEDSADKKKMKKKPVAMSDNSRVDMQPAVAKPLTAAEYLAAAPAEIRESLEAGLRMHTSHKAGLVKSLMANARNKFTQTQLEHFDVQTLENLAELGRAPDYSGMAPAGISSNSAQSVVDTADSEFAAAPPRLQVAAKQNAAA